ncbi:MAG TPA: hypothetical protein IAA29_09980 [Candidatus Paenibacillus intestinavium]|nr:hypothetical protein [Candidatus Paenibacillus intestinavium]
MHNYIGKNVQLIYVDSKRNVSTHNIKVIMSGDKRFIAYCYTAREVKIFNKSGIVDVSIEKSKKLLVHI